MKNSPEDIINQAKDFVRSTLEHESTGHDWFHIYRVTETAKTIAREEGADLFICELAALLHDIADAKLNPSEEIGLKKVADWLNSNGVGMEDAEHVLEIISTMSFKGGGKAPMRTLEGKVVQDADRLDAIGAIGIARVFTYSGAKGRPMHDPAVKLRDRMTEEEYRSGNDTAINHFYEKLLKLKDLMNTNYGRVVAAERHQFMLHYLEHFYAEWEGKAGYDSNGEQS
ncbi:HD domain-containing protein [Paenibacillus beijingensis]|uniref:Phosphohydrolase n=1 Tax=Paenibacillus beijingensis TaxID=1126833 RepID=A0A0D5NFV5_9BACL|nr:HD domain-containing protein [Paenibacillus beijingensis]AJY73793.1 phosphohydrolase [Paenibacillus beijingensis]